MEHWRDFSSQKIFISLRIINVLIKIKALICGAGFTKHVHLVKMLLRGFYVSLGRDFNAECSSFSYMHVLKLGISGASRLTHDDWMAADMEGKIFNDYSVCVLPSFVKMSLGCSVCVCVCVCVPDRTLGLSFSNSFKAHRYK